MKTTRLFAFAIAIFMVLGLIGCSTAKSKNFRYVALEVGSFDAEDGGTHHSEYANWSENLVNYHSDDTAKKSATVTFNGVTYTGDYQRSIVSVPNLYLSHRYSAGNVNFGINAETGKLTSVNYIYEYAEEPTIGKEDCRRIADAVADDYINLDDYKVTENVMDASPNFVCSYIYYREISGYQTNDRLTVTVDGNGNLSSFGYEMLGSFDGVESVEIDRTEVYEAIDAKVKTIYADAVDFTGYSMRSILLLNLGEEGYGLFCTIDIEGKNDNHSSDYCIQLLVKAE